MNSLSMLIIQTARLPYRIAAAASLASGIGSSEHEYKKAGLWLSAFCLFCSSLATGLAVKDKILALKLFVGITLFFGLDLHSMLSTLAWNQGGAIFTCMLIFSWAIIMAKTASKGLENAWAHFNEGFHDANSQWRRRSPEQAAANEHWHMSCEITTPMPPSSLPSRKRL